MDRSKSYNFQELKSNLKEFKHQQCYQALLHSTKGKWLDFCLLTIKLALLFMIFQKLLKIMIYFQNIKRNISMVDKIKLETQKLDDLILEKNIDVRKFNHWVIDVQEQN